MAVATYTKTGTKATTAAKLDKAVFGVTPTNFELLKRVYDAYLANGRANHATTKTRGEVRGGGKKPWKQKGTGNARVGSRRNPIWRGGGIVFGPTGEASRLTPRRSVSLFARPSALLLMKAVLPLSKIFKPRMVRPQNWLIYCKNLMQISAYWS
jgi:large subunit ribosomal protein L4